MSSEEVAFNSASMSSEEAFNISGGHQGGRIGTSTRRVRSFCWRKLPLVVSITIIFVVIVCLFLQLRGLTHTNSECESAAALEADLRALLLLRQQRQLLLQLSNTTSSSHSVKQRLLNLNEHIQDVLLSSYPSANVTPANGTEDVVICRKVDRPKDQRTIDWIPTIDRYLFTICTSGQISNHLICLEKHTLFAALLNRTLVLPSPKLDFQYERILDIDRINQCFSHNVVVSYDEFARTMKNKPKVDKFICYIASPPCFLDEDHTKSLQNLGISFGEIMTAWPDDGDYKEQKKRNISDVLPKFSSTDEVIAIGDMFYANVEEEWVMQPGGPLAHTCKTVLQPSRLIYITAQQFIQDFLGSNFVAVHFRRHGICNAKEGSCFFPIPQAAECILQVLEKSNAPIIYLYTDAADSETNLLQSLIVIDNKLIPMVKRPSHDAAVKWDSLLYKNHLDNDIQVEAMLDKTICALATVFIGAPGSTFTEDIIRLRKGWETDSHCDEYLCQGL